jgi:hypothetical protein
MKRGKGEGGDKGSVSSYPGDVGTHTHTHTHTHTQSLYAPISQAEHLPFLWIFTKASVCAHVRVQVTGFHRDRAPPHDRAAAAAASAAAVADLRAARAAAAAAEVAAAAGGGADVPGVGGIQARVPTVCRPPPPPPCRP